MLEGTNVIGEGSYGLVYAIKEDSGDYALKRNITDIDMNFLGAIRELNMLHTLREHPNIITLNKVIFGETVEGTNFQPLTGEDRSLQRDDAVHFIFPRAEKDLHEFIYDEEDESFTHIKKYLVDMLLGVEYIHNNHIIHRDIKPGNILLFPDNVVKICDFGFSKPYTIQGDQTPGIVTVTYRAPEIILSDPNYDYKIDVWSLGCVFFELVAKKPLVVESEDDNFKLMKNVLEVIEKPLNTVQFKEWITNVKSKDFKIRNMYSKSRPDYLEQLDLSKEGVKAFEEQCGNLRLFCNLLSNMIVFNPKNRYDIHECLNHAFFDSDRQYINLVRDKFKEKIYKEHPITYVLCKERQWMAETVNCLYNNRQNLEWYSHRCIFQAVDMFHRYLYAIYQNKTISLDKPQHDKFRTNLLFMACVYMSIKFFSSIHAPIPFSNIVEKEFLTPECQAIVADFEGGLIFNCFHYDIYNTTIYEAADFLNDKLDERDIRNLLIMSTQNNFLHDKLPSDVYKYYKLTLKNKNVNDLLNSF
jgi:cyclin-dependent kinase 2